ncbi:hypothetical protein [Falsiphaeobacter marinintestinus]|uniref:hypothetical protein n=1 Tax=Falsiphaeobacter marinintestinus TaxID=1492905 RepID=UPI0011B80F9B|nr:hypothetical protein [Phaeobacter marinintestinus]
MYKFVITACLAVSLSGAASAAELKGADIVAVLSGKTYACENKAKDKQMKMVFPKLNPATQEIPYTYTLDGKTKSGAYVFRNNGAKLVSKGSSQTRRVMQTSANSVQIIGRSGQYWLCIES